MKQWLLAFRPHKFGNVGANPTHHPSLKNKKGRLEVRPVGALPNITTRILGKAERTSKQPDLLPPTATPRLYQIISTRVNKTTFIFTWSY